MIQIDKERFIELCKDGDEYALGLLYTNYAPRMKRLCLRYVGDKATAEDILHDGFIIIMSRIHQLKDASKLDSWMAAIMRNLVLRHLGQKGKTVFISIEEIEENEDFAHDTLEIVSEYKKLLRLIETLPQGYRSVFKLSVFDNMSHKEIAALLGINSHSSSSQLARAKEMLRTIVTQYGFVPILIIALLYAVHLDEPKKYTKEETAEVAEHIEKTDNTNNKVAKVHRINVEETTLLLPELKTDTVTLEKTDTSVVEKTDTTMEEKIVLPNINDCQTPYNHIAGTSHERETDKWNVSMSYSGGLEANNSVFTEKPGSIISGEETETVETKTHHYMPFIVSLSLQKNLNSHWSVGTGLRYTRLKTDITTISNYETTQETQTVQYIGIPLSLNYNIWHTGKLSLYTSVGIIADIPVSGGETWQWSLSTGVGLQYQLMPSVSLFAEPSLNYHLNSDHGAPTIWTDRPFDITVPFGLRLSW